MESDLDSFARDGFAGPFPLFTADQCALVSHHWRCGEAPVPRKWEKGQAITDRLVFDLATRPALLRQLRLFLGDNICCGARVFSPVSHGKCIHGIATSKVRRERAGSFRFGLELKTRVASRLFS
jgi:hypothetical protein